MITDCGGRLRDPKYPTIGPVERLLPGRSGHVLYRYVHDSGAGVCSRETYRSAPEDASTLATPEVTHFLPVVPGTQAFMDDDGVTDVSVSDRYGEHLLWYRAREKRGAGLDAVPPALRGAGILNPLQLASAAFFEHPPWYQRVIEEDILSGRRGVAGWNGQTTDVGLFIPYWEPPSRRLAEAQGIDWSSGTTWAYIGLGALLVIGGIVLTIASGGTFLAVVAGGAIGGFGMGFGMTGAATHDFRNAMVAGGIGAVAGAAGGAIGYGVNLGVSAGLQTLLTSGRSLAQMGIATASGAASGAVGGGVHGFLSGTLGGLVAGESLSGAASAGWGLAKTQALWGGVIGGAAGLLSSGVAELRYTHMKQSILAKAGLAEAGGLKFTMGRLEDQGFRIQGDLLYGKSGHGIDLWGKGLGRKLGVTAVAEAKASGSLGALGKTGYGRQGGPMWVGHSVRAAASDGVQGARGVLHAFEEGKLEMYIGLTGSGRFGTVNTSVWGPRMIDINFRQAADAIRWL